MEDVILTPIYKNMFYQYHECSGCKKEIYFEEGYVPFHFEEKIKYCPYCGHKIIRYAEPKYTEPPNWDWLDEYEDIVEKGYRYLEYKIQCKLNEEERRKLQEKTEFGEEYFGIDSYYPTGKGNVCNLLNYICRQKLHYSTKKKLEQEFKGKD